MAQIARRLAIAGASALLAAPPVGQARPRIVTVGAGAAGLAVAARLRSLVPGGGDRHARRARQASLPAGLDDGLCRGRAASLRRHGRHSGLDPQRRPVPSESGARHRPPGQAGRRRGQRALPLRLPRRRLRARSRPRRHLGLPGGAGAPRLGRGLRLSRRGRGRPGRAAGGRRRARGRAPALHPCGDRDEVRGGAPEARVPSRGRRGPGGAAVEIGSGCACSSGSGGSGCARSAG